MTKTHISPLSCTVLAAAALAFASFGAARADAAVKFKPTRANLQHFVLAQGDLPDGYKADGWMNSRSPGGCVELGAIPPPLAPTSASSALSASGAAKVPRSARRSRRRSMRT